MTSETERPDGWPEMFSAAGSTPACPHQFVWDTADGVYGCIYCDETRAEPPESYRESNNDDTGKSAGDTTQSTTTTDDE